MLCSGVANAEIQTEAVRYQDGDVTLRGHLVWDDAIAGKRPGVIVVHEWWGLNDYARKRARMLAELGYAAFAIDMYGEGKITKHGKDAKAWMSQITSNVHAWRKRAQLGLEMLKSRAIVDPDNIAAIGYCFGGATVMQMAYAGLPLKGVASFHGSLPPASAEEAKSIQGQIFVAHGDDDGFVPAERIAKFLDGLRVSGKAWQFTRYGGTKHSFTNPDADKAGIDGLGYNPIADKRSWAALQVFLGDIFASK
ncbi:dienelactone hydrolase family protein [Magnetofaba australis]|nr:dienelactone hydrolase family protein [Magnetofaba australis]